MPASRLQEQVHQWRDRVSAAALHAQRAGCSSLASPGAGSASLTLNPGHANAASSGGNANGTGGAMAADNGSGSAAGTLAVIPLPPSDAVASAAARGSRSAAGQLQQASAALNQLTGYHEISALRGAVAAADEQLQRLKAQLTDAKAEFEQRLAQQAQLQKDINNLLQRKNSWAEGAGLQGADAMSFVSITEKPLCMKVK